MFSLKEPPSVPKPVSPEHYRRMGWIIIGFGVVASAAGYAYMLKGGMPAGTSFVSVLPLFGIATALGWSYLRMGQEGATAMVGYLSACVGLCALVAAWWTGR